MDKKIIIFFAFALLLGLGSAWAQDPCTPPTYTTCSGGNVVLTHDASCGSGGHYAWAAFEDDGNYWNAGSYTAPSYSTSGFGGSGTGIGGGWGKGENYTNWPSGSDNFCHYPGALTLDMRGGNDPWILFPVTLPGGADPNIYKYFVLRYQINTLPSSTSNSDRTMEIYFMNDNYSSANEAQKVQYIIPETSAWGTGHKCSTDQYAMIVIDLSTHSAWTTGGKITAIRFDPMKYNAADEDGKRIHMSVDYIGLVANPPAAPDHYAQGTTNSFPNQPDLTLSNVTADQIVKSYRIVSNGQVDYTGGGNPEGYVRYGWTATMSQHQVHVYAELNAGEISTSATSVCQGETTTLSTISETTAASQAETEAVLSYQWYYSKDGGTRTAITDATSAEFTPNISDYNTNPGVYVFTRDVISNLCTTSPKTSDGAFTLTIKAKPSVTVSNQTFYTNDGDKTVTLTSTPTGATFAWTNNNTAIGLAASGTGNVGPFTPATSSSDDEVATITVTPTLEGCTGDAATFTITVKNSVQMNDITTYSASACSGSNVTATFTSPIEGVSYKWSHDNTNVTPATGDPVAGTGANSTGAFSVAFSTTATAAQTVTFSVTPTKVIGGSNVDGPAKTFTVDIYPLPAVSITAPTTVCPKSTPTFTGTVTTTTTGDYTYTWDGDGDGFEITPSGPVTQSATTHTPTTVKAPNNCDQTFTVRLTVEDGHGCMVTATKTIAVKDETAPTIADFTVPAATAAGNCQYAIPDLESAVIAATTDDCGGTITWVSQSIAAGTKYDQGAIAQNITVTVNVKDACNNPQSKTVTVTIPANDLAVNATANPTAMCLELSSALSASVTGGLGTPTYAWSSTSTGAGMPTTVNTASINVTPTAAGAKTYTVSVTDGNGCSKTKDVAVTVYELPTIDATNASQTITYGHSIDDIVITNNTESTVSLSMTSTELAAIGLAYDDATKTISGTPNAGTHTITATATSTHDCGTATKVITLNVGKKALTITYTGTENTKVYDGTPLTISYDKLTYTGLVTGDEITSGVITTDGYKVGTYVCNAGSFSRMWADGTASPSGFGPASVTQNYSVQFNVTLSITVRPLEITANSASKEYDATPLTDPGYSYTNSTSLASTDEATVTVEGSQLCPGSSNNTVTAVSITHTSDNEPVTDCYEITLKKGTLEVTPLTCPTTLAYEGYTYPIVQVGNQCWFAENLRAAATGAVPYDNESSNTDKFGLLYNWSEALAGNSTISTDPCYGQFVRGNCPDGWAIPSAADFDELQTFAGDMKAIRSNNAAYWLPEYVGTNSTNFDERGGGLFNASTNRFEELRSAAYFWTSEAVLHAASFGDGVAHCYCDEYYCGMFIPKIITVESKLSVRCIRKTVPGLTPPTATCPSLGATSLSITNPEANGYLVIQNATYRVSTPIVNYDASVITDGKYKIIIAGTPTIVNGTVDANGLVAELPQTLVEDINITIASEFNVSIIPVLTVTCNDPSGEEIEGAGITYANSDCPKYMYYGVQMQSAGGISVAADVYNATSDNPGETKFHG